MGLDTVAVLRAAVEDPMVVARYRSHILQRGERECSLWTGAISGRGHGRFQLGDAYVPGAGGERRRITYVVIAHRFGFAVEYGVDALLRVPLLAHRCDNPLCQNPRCWRESNHMVNRREYIARRGSVLGALADTRGARGRAREIRDAARAGEDVEAAGLLGAHATHRAQLRMFAEPSRVYSDEPDRRAGAAGSWLAETAGRRLRWVEDRSADGEDPVQGVLFGEEDDAGRV